MQGALLIQTDYVAMTVLGEPRWSDGFPPKLVHHRPDFPIPVLRVLVDVTILSSCLGIRLRNKMKRRKRKNPQGATADQLSQKRNGEGTTPRIMAVGNLRQKN